MFFFVSAFLLLLVLQGCSELLDENGQHLVQRIHHTPLEPLGNCSPGMMEAQFLQDVVHTHRVNLASCPGDKPEDRGNRVNADETFPALLLLLDADLVAPTGHFCI